MDLLQKGWECPKCGAVMSPTTSVCINCRGITETVISTNYTGTPLTPEEVRKMTQREVKINYQAIIDSMKEWD